MIDIIRINAKYKKALSRLTEKEKAYILDWIFSFANDEFFEIKDSSAWDLLELINWENELMCIKAIWKTKYNENKAKNPMVEPMVWPMVWPMESAKVKESNIKESKVNKSNIIIKETKHKYWEYKNVLLTDKQKDKFIEDFWESVFYKYVKIVDEYIQVTWKVYKDHNLVMRKFKNNDKNKKEINHASDTWVVLAPKVF